MFRNQNQGRQTPAGSWGSTAIPCCVSRTGFNGTAAKVLPKHRGHERSGQHRADAAPLLGPQEVRFHQAATCVVCAPPSPQRPCSKAQLCTAQVLITAWHPGCPCLRPVYLCSSPRPGTQIPSSVTGLWRACFQTTNEIQNKAS